MDKVIVPITIPTEGNRHFTEARSYGNYEMLGSNAQRTEAATTITVVDAKHLPEEINGAHEMQPQLTFADIDILNKAVLMTIEELAGVEARKHIIDTISITHLQFSLDRLILLVKLPNV